MVLETAQLLCTAHRVVDGKRVAKHAWLIEDDRELVLYKATHVAHPCAVWVRASTDNYAWAFSLFLELLKEYTFRYQKQHACTRLVETLKNAPNKMIVGAFADPPKCMPDECRVSDDAVACYREYYRTAKRQMLDYKRRDPPAWI
jgi:hypothetical protein